MIQYLWYFSFWNMNSSSLLYYQTAAYYTAAILRAVNIFYYLFDKTSWKLSFRALNDKFL